LNYYTRRGNSDSKPFNAFYNRYSSTLSRHIEIVKSNTFCRSSVNISEYFMPLINQFYYQHHFSPLVHRTHMEPDKLKSDF